MKKGQSEREFLLDFLAWMQDSDSGFGVCYLNEKDRPVIKKLDRLLLVKEFLNSPERKEP